MVFDKLQESYCILYIAQCNDGSHGGIGGQVVAELTRA